MRKRVICFILALLMLPCSALAMQSHPESFRRDYYLTGDPAEDICRVAKVQGGLCRSELGYTNAWCAEFVCDCARLAGVPSSVIPRSSSCTTMYNSLMENGASIVYIPQAGDLVFYVGKNRRTGERFIFHVGIMTGRDTSVQGNIGNGEKRVRADMDPNSLGRRSYDWECRYVRPVYSVAGDGQQVAFLSPYKHLFGRIFTFLLFR